MSVVRNFLQHVFSPLHIYCRLMDLKCSERAANRWASKYERWIYRRVFG